MNKYQTPERPDPRIRTTYVKVALDSFHQVGETGQGQIIFMTGADGSGYPDTLQAIDDQLRDKLGFIYHSKRVHGFTFQNGYLHPWRVVDQPAWMSLIGTLVPMIQAVATTPFLSSFTTINTNFSVSLVKLNSESAFVAVDLSFGVKRQYYIKFYYLCRFLRDLDTDRKRNAEKEKRQNGRVRSLFNCQLSTINCSYQCLVQSSSNVVIKETLLSFNTRTYPNPL